MRRKVFFSHLLDTDPMIVLVEKLIEIEAERMEILDMIDSTLHHKIIHKLLDELPDEQHELFLEGYSKDPSNEELLVFLKQYVPDIESKISAESQTVQKSLYDEIGRMVK
jgi:hypothetical protein